jgi:hypothetical protein
MLLEVLWASPRVTARRRPVVPSTSRAALARQQRAVVFRLAPLTATLAFLALSLCPLALPQALLAAHFQSPLAHLLAAVVVLSASPSVSALSVLVAMPRSLRAPRRQLMLRGAMFAFRAATVLLPVVPCRFRAALVALPLAALFG